MKDALKRIVDSFHKYNSEHMAMQVFGLSEDMIYDALVVAPSFSPYMLQMDKDYEVIPLKERAYTAGYLVKKDNLRIAWIKIGSSAGNLIDHLSLCAELAFNKLIFIGAVGALKEDFSLGDVCTPSYSISGSYADSYLMKKTIKETMLFEKVIPNEKYVSEVIRLAEEKGYQIKRGSVFCTPSIALEYTHLDEIRAYDTDLIEMETASFYLMADLFELPSIALLVVSDNSASGVALFGRTEEQQIQYDYRRNNVLPDMIMTIADS